MVRIVDMDEMSDADRNSDAGSEEVLGLEDIGNDVGDGLNGIVGAGGGVEGVRREEVAVMAEVVPRWGVVLVQGDRLEGAFLGEDLALSLGGEWDVADECVGREERVVRTWSRSDCLCAIAYANQCEPWDSKLTVMTGKYGAKRG